MQNAAIMGKATKFIIMFLLAQFVKEEPDKFDIRYSFANNEVHTVDLTARKTRYFTAKTILNHYAKLLCTVNIPMSSGIEFTEIGAYTELNFRSLCFRNTRPPVHGGQELELRPAYTGRRPISEAKFKDLATLCRKNVIPPAYHHEYLGLPHAGVRDQLAEPDAEESDGDD